MRNRLIAFAPLLALLGLLFLAVPASASQAGNKVYDPAGAWSNGTDTYTLRMEIGIELLGGNCRPFIILTGKKNGVPQAGWNYTSDVLTIMVNGDGDSFYEFRNVQNVSSPYTLATTTWYNGVQGTQDYVADPDGGGGGASATFTARAPGGAAHTIGANKRSFIVTNTC